jgi:hypothetical protein
MAWTASIGSVNRVGDRIEVSASFTDGKTSFSRMFSYDTMVVQSKEEIWAAVKRTLDGLNNADTITASLTAETPVFSEPTKEQVDREAWYALYRKLEVMNGLVRLGVISADSTEYVELLNEVKAKFSVSYL